MELLYSPKYIKDVSIIPRDEHDDFMPGMIRNTYREFNGHLVRGSLCNPEDFADYDEICLDFGVINICKQDPYTLIKSLGNKVKAIILRDSNMFGDRLAPFSSAQSNSGSFDWNKALRALKEIHFDGTIIIDYWDSIANTPAYLRKSYETYVHEIGKYIYWELSINSNIKKHAKRVLFGAGNMCRSYMKYYGKDYPPLFTCDNNPKRWGEIFDGLEIKNPESLKELDPDTAIIICNMYYDEIEAQIKEMGITNPIEKFSDACLLHNPKDRLEMWKGND